MKLFRGFLLMSASQLASIGTTLISRVFMARLLGPAVYGGFGVGINLITVLSKALAFGMLPAVQYHASKKQESTSDFLRTVLWLALALSVGLTALAAFVVPRVSGFYFDRQPITASVFPVLALGILPIVLGGALASVLIPWGRISAYAAIQFAPGVIVLLAFLALAAVMPPLSAAVQAQLIAWGVAVLYNLWVVRPELRGGRFQRGLAIRLIRFGVSVWPNVLLGIGSGRIAVVMGAVFVAAADIGFFVVALNIVEGVLAFHAPIGQLLFTRVSEREHRAFSITQESMRLSAIVLACLSFAFVAIGRPILIAIWGREFAAAWPLALALIGTGVSRALMRVLNNFLAGMGRPSLNTITLAVETSLLVALIPLLTASGGALGLAIATLASAVVALGIATRHTCRVMQCSPAALYLTRRGDLVALRRRVQNLMTRKEAATGA